MQRAAAYVHSQGKQHRKAAEPEQRVKHRVGFQASSQDTEDVICKPYAKACERRADKLEKLAGYVKLHLSEQSRQEAAGAAFLLVA